MSTGKTTQEIERDLLEADANRIFEAEVILRTVAYSQPGINLAPVLLALRGWRMQLCRRAQEIET